MKPSPTDISDLIETIRKFVDENPDWMENDKHVARLGVAYHILTTISDPDMVTEEEYEFVIDIHNTIKARSAQ
jgi:hypothetical protein